MTLFEDAIFLAKPGQKAAPENIVFSLKIVTPLFGLTPLFPWRSLKPVTPLFGQTPLFPWLKMKTLFEDAIFSG